jgi:uracil-DNA glycosylase family protein
MSRNERNSQSGQRAIPFSDSIETLAEAAKTCRACDIWSRATQTVFGEGNPRAEVMLVGEQPGNQEDLAGHPFVGPAGKLLDKALLAAGIARDKIYITNVVKHFNSTQRGKSRIHKRPNAEEIAACRPWLEAEIATIRPTIVVCLGANAAQALISRDYRVTRQRGELQESSFGPTITATVHPSSILRAPDGEARHLQMREFVADLKKIARALPLAPAATRCFLVATIILPIATLAVIPSTPFLRRSRALEPASRFPEQAW